LPIGDVLQRLLGDRERRRLPESTARESAGKTAARNHSATQILFGNNGNIADGLRAEAAVPRVRHARNYSQRKKDGRYNLSGRNAKVIVEISTKRKRLNIGMLHRYCI
jgi:hypothetical protein